MQENLLSVLKICCFGGNIVKVILMKKLIMTDLDCTLLPMDQEKYIAIYVNEIAKLFYEHGFDGKAVAKATMQASMAMLKNDGSRINAEAFEESFTMLLGENGKTAIDIFPQVYGDRYNNIRVITSVNPFAKDIVELMRSHAEHIVVATQPMFPIEAVKKRLSWTNLTTEMFDYVTTYDVCRYSKPNPMYYKEIMDRFGATPENTVMIGNDVNEDILPCEELGIDTFLVLDGLINVHNHDISHLNQGDYLDLMEYLKTL